jgi:tetraacyldisaccharide 4'-kinase
MAQGQHSNSAKLEAWLHRAWSHRGLWAHMTWPLSKVLWWLHCMRERLAQKASSPFFSFSNDERGGFRKNRLPVPLVVVGNVFVGGVGKTPLVIALVEHLQAQGLKVGVIARGHGSNNQGVQVLNASSTAEQLGDEPLLVHHRTQAPVVVGVDRLKAAQTLLEHFPQTQVILSDDGLQRLKRWADLVVCVFDERGVEMAGRCPLGHCESPGPERLLARTNRGSSCRKCPVCRTQPLAQPLYPKLTRLPPLDPTLSQSVALLGWHVMLRVKRLSWSN